MADVKLNTRISLRYDTYETWNSKNPVLNKGEVAIAYLSQDAVKNGPKQEPQHPILMKVGDGTTTFNSLPWVSALAADVYAWARSEKLPFEVKAENDGNVVSNVTWENNKLVITKGFKAASYAELQQAISDLTASIGDVNNQFANYATASALKTAKSDLNTAIGNAKSELEGKINLKANTADVENTYYTKAAHEEYASSVTSAIGTAQQAAEDKAAELVNVLKNGDVKNNADAIKDLQDTIGTGAGAESVTGRLAALEAELPNKAATAWVTEQLGTKVNTDDFSNEQTRVNGELEKKVNVTTFNEEKERVNGELAKKAVASVVETALSDKADKTYAEQTRTTVETLVGSDSNKSVRTIANEELAAQLLHENGAVDNFTTLKELATWLEQHPEDAATMNTAIQTNAGDIDKLEAILAGFAAGTDAATVKGYIDAIESELDGKITNITEDGGALAGVRDYADQAAADAAAGALAEAKEHANTAASTAKSEAISEANSEAAKLAGTAKSEAITEAGNLATAAKEAAIDAAATDASTKADAAKAAAIEEAQGLVTVALSEAQKYTDAKVVAQSGEALAEAKTYADGKASAAKDDAIAAAKSYTDTQLDSYYTKTEADAEFINQSELDASHPITSVDTGLKIDNKKLMFDNSVTFIFDCGDASGNALLS